MSKSIKFSEVFYSLQGEGPYAGLPTVFLRFFGCNLTCGGFGRKPTDDLREYTVPISRIEEFDTLGIAQAGGCDSAYSWHPLYKNVRQEMSATDFMAWLKTNTPNRPPIHPYVRNNWFLSFTGGEPMLMLHQEACQEIVEKLLVEYSIEKEVDGMPSGWHAPSLLIETNGTIPLSDRYGDTLACYADEMDRTVAFSISPKLSNSGEPPERARRKLDQVIRSIVDNHYGEFDVYLKFVSDGSDESIQEIMHVTQCAYQETEALNDGLLCAYVMPEGATREQLAVTAPKVAKLCLEYGLGYSPRLHVDLFGNAVGT